MTNPTIKIHERIMQTVVELTEEEHDPFAWRAVCSPLLFLYTDLKKWNGIRLVPCYLNVLNKVLYQKT